MTVSLNTSATAATPTVTSTGLGSGLNVNSIVTSLVSATIQPQQTLLTNTQTSDQATLSALAQVKSSLSSLQSSVDAITSGGALKQLTATTGNSAVFSATAGSGAVAGSYQVQVTQLAQANTIASSAYTSSTAAVGAGTYSISAGSTNFSVTMTATNTLADLRDAINSSSSNSGVSATIVNGSDGAHLLLSSSQTGTANAVALSSTSSISFSTIRAASDAQVSVDGFNYTSSSNIVTGALDGVTLNLASASPGTDISLNVSADQNAAANAIQTFVSAYNSTLSLINQSTAYTPGATSGAAGSSGPLLGDLTIQRLSQQLQSIVGNGVTGTGGFNLLSQIGVTEATDGSLSVNSTTLNSALQQNSTAVQNLFSASGSGIGSQFDTLLNNYVSTGGTIDSESKGVQSQLDDIASKLSDLTTKQSDLQTRLFAQFNAMDAAVGKYKSIGSFLTTYAASINGTSSTSSSSSGG